MKIMHGFEISIGFPGEQVTLYVAPARHMWTQASLQVGIEALRKRWETINPMAGEPILQERARVLGILDEWKGLTSKDRHVHTHIVPMLVEE